MSGNNKAYTFPWEPMAQRGEEIPDGLSRADQLMYIMLRSLYGQVRGKVITREVAVKEKKRLLEDYRAYQFQDQMYDSLSESLRKTELARAAFRKNPDLESAWNLIDALEGR